MSNDEEENKRPDLSHITLQKMVRVEESAFIKKCRATLSDLTGEEFVVEKPHWLKFAGMRLEADGYCERLKMAIDYQPPVLFYNLPPELHGLYNDPQTYSQFLDYVNEARFITNYMNGFAVILIPGIMSDKDLRDYLCGELHALTKFRVWVGSPRCKCPSLMVPDDEKR